MTTHSSTTTPSPTTPQVAEPPRFAKGDRARVPEHYWLDYYLALPHNPRLDLHVVAGGGVIMQMRQNKRTGGRSYQVLFNLGDGWGREDMYIREEHLVMVEAAHPAPETPETPQSLRHAYECTDFRDARPLGGDVWCEAGGCAMYACPVCRAQASQQQRRKTRESKEPHTHRWQPFGSDAHFEFCAGCGQGRRTDRISDNPGVRLYGAARGDATNERCVTCAYAVEVQKHYDHWTECTQDPQHGYRHQLALTWPACARWTLQVGLKRGGKKEGEQ